MVKVAPGELHAEDLLVLGFKKGVRTALTPFGEIGVPHRYIGRSVAWKGGSFQDLPPGVQAGLRRAIAISQQFRGVRGTTTATVNGVTKFMPAKAAAQAKAAGHTAGGRRSLTTVPGPGGL